MNGKEEKSYFEYLEKLIKSENYDAKNEAACDRLVNKILRKSPGLKDKVLTGIIDTTSINDFSEKDLIDFILARTRKGTVIKYRDEKGKNVYIVNHGHDGNGKIRLKRYENSFLEADGKALKKYLLKEALKSDLKLSYRNMNQNEMMNVRKENKNVRKRIDMKPKSRKDIMNSLGFFEKRCIREYLKNGGTGDMGDAVRNVLLNMTAVEQQHTSVALYYSGLTNPAARNAYFSSLMNKAMEVRQKLNDPKPVPEIDYQLTKNSPAHQRSLFG